MFAYVVSGLTVASDLALPGLIPIAGLRDPSVAVRRARVPTMLDGAQAHGPNWQMAGDQFLIRVPGIVAMLLTAGREIVYELMGDTEPRDAAIFVSGTGFGILLHQRGRIVLHASAVRVRDRAVLFCGPSGAGKSTLAAALGKTGYELLSDDFCGFSLDPQGPPRVHPDGRQLKLWENAIEHLSLAEQRTDRVRTRIGKFYLTPSARAPEALPVGAIYILREERPPDVAGIAAPNIVDGALLLRANAYRPALVRRMDQAALYFQATAALARGAGPFTLTRPLGFANFDTVIGWLEAHWRDLGLMEQAA